MSKLRLLKQLQSPENRRRLIWSAGLRYGTLLVLWMVLVLPADGWRVATLPLCHVFIALMLLLNTVYLLCFWQWRYVIQITHAATVLDVLAISALVYATGMTQSPFVLLYFVQIMSAILLVNVLQALLASIFGLVTFTVLAGGTALGLIYRFPPVASAQALLEHPIYMPSMLVVLCLFVGYSFMINLVLGKGVRERGLEIQQSLDKLRSAKNELMSSFHRLEAMGDRLSKERRDRERAQDVLWRMERLTTQGRLAGASLPLLRQYLTAIIGQIELVASGRLKDEPALQAAKRASETSQRLDGLLEMIAPKSDQDGRELFGPVQLNEVVSSCMAQLENEALQRQAVIESSLDEELPAVHGVRLQLEQIVLSLLSYSLDSLPAEIGHIKVETGRSDDGSVLLTLSDNGRGLTDENMARLFSPFYNPDKAVDPSGLGLHLARILAQRHGGDVSVKPSPGRGATFTVTLPSD